MKPFIWWMKAAQEAMESEYARAGACGGGHSGRHRGHRGHHRHGPSEDGGVFGVRRPLRVMARRLELDEDQVAELAAILDDIKNARAQAALDERKTVSAFAEAMAADSFDEDAVRAEAQKRVESAEALRDAVTDTLRRTHALLTTEQRRTLAYLLRSGALTILATAA